MKCCKALAIPTMENLCTPFSALRRSDSRQEVKEEEVSSWSMILTPASPHELLHLLELFNGKATAYKVAIAIGIIYPANSGPEFAFAHKWKRIRRLLPAVRSIPIVGSDNSGSMRGMFKNVV